MKKKSLLISVLGILFVFSIWTFALTSDEYRLVRETLKSEELIRHVGEIDRHFVTGFRFSYRETNSSSFSLYVMGGLKRGWLRVALQGGEYGPKVTSISFDGEYIATQPNQ